MIVGQSYDAQRRISRIITVANVVIVLAAGFYALGLGIFGRVPTVASESISWPVRVLMIVAGAVVLVVDIAFLRYRYFSRYDEFLDVKTPDGIVQVAVPAIEQSLARMARSLPEVHDARVRIRRLPGEGAGVLVRVNYAAWEGGNVPAVSQKVQQVLQLRFEQICGSEIVPRYEVSLTRIDVKEMRKVAAKAGGETEEPVDLFRGPVYPTGDEY